MKAGPGDSDKIRLPELPVFKRFSLALRQEYATADEILAVIDRTVSRIKDLLERIPDREPDAESELVRGCELERELEREPTREPEEDRRELFVESPESV